MSDESFIKTESARCSWEKYYSVLRPVGIETQPKSGFMGYINYDNRIEVNGKMVWAELYYNRKLTKKEMRDYDLVK